MENSYMRIVNMTNEEAADILKALLINHGPHARANGKSMTHFAIHVALMKAIRLLDITPDEKEKENG